MRTTLFALMVVLSTLICHAQTPDSTGPLHRMKPCPKSPIQDLNLLNDIPSTWYVDVNGTAPGTGSAIDPYTSIQYGISQSSTIAGDTLLVRTGTYVEYINFNGKAIKVRSESGPGVTIIDGNQLWSVVSFTSGEGLGAVLDGFTITNGIGENTTGFTHGGGIICDASSPTISNNIITGNVADIGGAIYFNGPSTPVLENCTIINNVGVGCPGVFCSESAPTINENYIVGNIGTLAGGSGGGISLSHCSPVITNNIIEGNLTGTGGGVYCKNANPLLEDNKICGNSAATGGGLKIQQGSAPTIRRNHIGDNWASVDGGGIYCGSSASPAVLGNIIVGNIAVGNGGGVYCSSASATITGNTITENSADYGSAIFCTSNASANVLNTILWNNDASTGSELWMEIASSMTIDFSDVEGGISSANWDPGCTFIYGNQNIETNPLFYDPDQGDYRLKQSPPQVGEHSDCVDAGDPGTNPVPTGSTRTDWVQDVYPTDIGAHYLKPVPSPPDLDP